MRTDDPRLEKGHKEFVERSKKMDTLTLAAIKGHLLAEQAMDEFLAAALFHLEFIRESRFRFSQKAQLCQSLALNQQHDKIWALLVRANTLRNTIAHRKSAHNIKSAVGAVRSLYASVLGTARAKDVPNSGDQAVEAAFLFCAGSLAALAEDAKARRKVIDEHWKPPQ